MSVHVQLLCEYVFVYLDATEIVHDTEDRHCAQRPACQCQDVKINCQFYVYKPNIALTDGTYSPFGANSQISNQTNTSCLANTVDDGGHGNGPNFGLRTGWLIGMLGGSIRLGGGRVWNSCLASLCNG